MELSDKKVNFFGDSITANGGFIEYLSDKYKTLQARNYGLSGSRIARQRQVDIRDFIERVDDMETDADIIIVFGGTNDYGHGDAGLGMFDDHTPYSFYGACHVLMEKLINKYPSSFIMFMTPMHRQNENNNYGGMRRVKGAHLKEYVKAIREVAEYYSLPVLDLCQ